MPIKGLSDQKRQLPRLGKIHLGIRNGKNYPMKVNYFVVPDDIKKYVGVKPKELRVLIPVEDEENWASQFYRCYSKTRGLVCKGDGEKCLRLVNTQTGEMLWKEDVPGEMKEAPCKGQECSDYKVKCREVMNLQFLLPDVPGLGVWQIDTTSINSIRNINNESAFIKAAYGRISGLPLTLTLEPKEGRTPERKVVTIYVLHLRTKLILSEMMALAAKSPEDVILELPVGDEEIPELLLPENQEPLQTPPAAQDTTAQAGKSSQSPDAKEPTPGAAGQPFGSAGSTLLAATPAERLTTGQGKLLYDMRKQLESVLREKGINPASFNQIAKWLGDHGFIPTTISALGENELREALEKAEGEKGLA